MVKFLSDIISKAASVNFLDGESTMLGIKKTAENLVDNDLLQLHSLGLRAHTVDENTPEATVEAIRQEIQTALFNLYQLHCKGLLSANFTSPFLGISPRLCDGSGANDLYVRIPTKNTDEKDAHEEDDEDAKAIMALLKATKEGESKVYDDLFIKFIKRLRIATPKAIDCLKNIPYYERWPIIIALDSTIVIKKFLDKLLSFYHIENFNYYEMLRAAEEIDKIDSVEIKKQFVSFLKKVLEKWLSNKDASKDNPSNEDVSEDNSSNVDDHFSSLNETGLLKQIGRMSKLVAEPAIVNGLFKLLDHKDARIQCQALATISQIAPEEMAVPNAMKKLPEFLSDENTQYMAVEIVCRLDLTLVRLDSSVIEILFELLNEKILSPWDLFDDYERESIAAIIIKAICKLGKDAIIKLLKILNKYLADKETQVTALKLIAYIDGTEADSKDLMGSLEKLLSDEDKHVKKYAVAAIGALMNTTELSESLTTKFFDTLENLLLDEDDEICSSALETIEKLVKKKKPIRGDVLETLCHFTSKTDTQSASNNQYSTILSIIHVLEADQIVPSGTLIGLISNYLKIPTGKTSLLNFKIYEILSRPEKAAVTPEFLATLAQLLMDKNEDVQIQAIRAIESIGPAAVTDDIREKLCGLLMSSNQRLRRVAAIQLSSLLEKCCATDESHVLISPSFLQGLFQILSKHKDDKVRSTLISTFAHLAPSVFVTHFEKWIHSPLLPSSPEALTASFEKLSYLVMGAYLSASISLQVGWNVKEESFVAQVVVVEKSYEFTISPKQAQILVRMVPAVIKQLQKIGDCQVDFLIIQMQEWPRVDKDQLLKELRTIASNALRVDKSEGVSVVPPPFASFSSSTSTPTSSTASSQTTASTSTNVENPAGNDLLQLHSLGLRAREIDKMPKTTAQAIRQEIQTALFNLYQLHCKGLLPANFTSPFLGISPRFCNVGRLSDLYVKIIKIKNTETKYESGSDSEDEELSQLVEFIKHLRIETPKVVVFLRKLLNDYLNDSNIQQAIIVLDSEETTDELFRHLTRRSSDDRKQVLYYHTPLIASEIIRINSPKIRTRLLNFLKDLLEEWLDGKLSRDSLVTLLQAIGELGKFADEPDTLKKLYELLDHSDWEVRCQALETISKINPETMVNLDVMKKLQLFNLLKNEKIQRQVLEKICKIDLRSTKLDESSRHSLLELVRNECKPPYEKLLSGSDDDVVETPLLYVAIKAIGQLDKETTLKFFEILNRWLVDENEAIQAIGLKAIRYLDRAVDVADSKDIMENLEKSLSHEKQDIRKYAAWAIANIMKTGRKLPDGLTTKFFDVLKNLLLDEDIEAHFSARSIIAELGDVVVRSDVLETLLQTFTPPRHSDSGCSYAMQIITTQGPTAATTVVLESIGNLLKISAHSERININIKRELFKTLNKFGKAAATPEFLATLIQLMADKDIGIQCGAIDAIGAIGPAAVTDDIREKLCGLLMSSNQSLRRVAAIQLSSLLEKCCATDELHVLISPSFLKRLFQILSKHEDDEVRSALIKALAYLAPSIFVTHFWLWCLEPSLPSSPEALTASFEKLSYLVMGAYLSASISLHVGWNVKAESFVAQVVVVEKSYGFTISPKQAQILVRMVPAVIKKLQETGNCQVDFLITQMQEWPQVDKDRLLKELRTIASNALRVDKSKGVSVVPPPSVRFLSSTSTPTSSTASSQTTASTSSSSAASSQSSASDAGSAPWNKPRDTSPSPPAFKK